MVSKSKHWCEKVEKVNNSWRRETRLLEAQDLNEVSGWCTIDALVFAFSVNELESLEVAKITDVVANRFHDAI
jgi:hypothetical protein